jgi:hypothetical protein
MIVCDDCGFGFEHLYRCRDCGWATCSDCIDAEEETNDEYDGQRDHVLLTCVCEQCYEAYEAEEG